MLLRGMNVALLDSRENVILDGSEGLAVVTAKRGDPTLEQCQALICPAERGGSLRGMSERDRREAEGYYNGRRLFPVQVYLPTGGWRRIADVRVIWYVRSRDRDGRPWKHEFTKNIICHESTGQVHGYRLSLPRGCIITDSGFSEP